MVVYYCCEVRLCDGHEVATIWGTLEDEVTRKAAVAMSKLEIKCAMTTEKSS
jgi:hypothetical protein